MIKDSGTRRTFATGAVRDIQDNKGRCDLLPLDIVSKLTKSRPLVFIDIYVRKGTIRCLELAIAEFIKEKNEDIYTALLEVAKHYEEGATKYSERNWEKGINLHCYIDSAVRHYLKYKRGDIDERHDRSFVWNILGAMWTHENKPELIDLPFVQNNEGSEE